MSTLVEHPEAASEIGILESAKGALGTGLRWVDLATMTLLSVALFLLYPVALWSAPGGSSHVGRFLVSYLTVVPLLAGVMWLRLRRIDWSALTAAVLFVWAIKMLVTVGLYHGLVTKVSPHHEPPVAHAPSARRASLTAYEAVPGFAGAEIRARVVSAGRPLVTGFVVLSDIVRGKPFAAPSAPAARTLAVTARGFDRGLLVLPLASEILLRNETSVMLVVQAEQSGRTLHNVPLVAGGSARALRLTSPGLIELSIRGEAAASRAWVYMAEHPYVAELDAEGRFTMTAVPPADDPRTPATESHRLIVHALSPTGAAPQQWPVTLRAAASEGAEVEVELLR